MAARRITDKGKRVIVGIVANFWDDIFKSATKYGRNATVLCLPWSGFTSNSWLNTPDSGTLSYKNEQGIKNCLEKRNDWPSLFKEMVSACIRSAWIRWPGLRSDGEWMLFLNKLYETLYTSNTESEFEEALKQLIARGMPSNWLLPTCNRHSLLRAISVFNRWKDNKNTEVVESVKNSKYDILLLSGNVPEKDEREWTKWFDDQYNFCQVDFEYDALLDVAMAIERRSRLSNKK